MSKKKKEVETIGQRLAQLRKKRGLTMIELATETGINQSQISLYENDQNLPSAQVVIKFAEAFETTTDFILLGSSPYDSEDERFITHYKSLPEEKKYHLRKLVESIHALD
jgi:transcriptional regulator with XRE-family HTH domain